MKPEFASMKPEFVNSIVPARTPELLQKQIPLDDPEKLLLAYWLMFCRAPRRPEPDVDGFYYLGEIGFVKDKNWERLTPYSPAQLR